MMTKKDYEKAATIVSCMRNEAGNLSLGSTQRQARKEAYAVEQAFVMLFTNDNPRFDVGRFRKACQPKPQAK